MRPTLFYIPHEFLGIPVLGIGWVLSFLILTAIAVLATSRRKQSWSKVLEEQGAVWGVGALIVVFLLPQIETRIPDGTSAPWIVGLPIRGYGIMLMLGVVSALAIAMYRCERAGLSRDAFFSLATWSIVSGLLGARVFYVIQKWNELSGVTLLEKMWTALKVTEGGLVVYGGVFGGLLAVGLWSRKNRFPLLSLADCITPAFFIGLAFGRIGCLFNGCCYGGVCDTSFPSIAFPSGSPAYVDQMKSGQLIGIETVKESYLSGPPSIRHVNPNSWAIANKVHVGQKLVSIEETMVDGPTPNNPLAAPVYEVSVQVDNGRFHIPASELPDRALPVHPSQIYAAVSGLLLCIWTLLFSTIAKRTGVVFGVGLIAYGVLRIIEEIIRVDETGQFGTSLSIAQWISLGAMVVGIGLVIFAKKPTTLNSNSAGAG